MQIPNFKIQGEWPLFYSLGKQVFFFYYLQGRPEFSEVVTKLEECLCNIEVRTLASKICPYKKAFENPRMLGNAGKMVLWKESECEGP